MSGFGVNGTTSRCFWFYKDYAKCMSEANDPRECKLDFDDYMECQDHRKEKLRMNAIEMQKWKVEKRKKLEEKERKKRENEELRKLVEQNWRQRAGRVKQDNL